MKRKISILILATIAIFVLTGNHSIAATKFWKHKIGKNVVISNGFTFDELEHRKGKMYIEITTGKVIGNSGEGKENVPRGKQDFIRYPEKFKKGTKMRSIIIYNPESNYTDDILFIYHMKRR